MIIYRCSVPACEVCVLGVSVLEHCGQITRRRGDIVNHANAVGLHAPCNTAAALPVRLMEPTGSVLLVPVSLRSTENPGRKR
jgi:hypothetical protein